MENLDQIKQRLEARLTELTNRAREINDELAEPVDDDWEEAATEASNDEVLEEIGEVTVEEIALIKKALNKIEAGSFGICDACGEDIAPGRLEAIPYATKCINCA